MVGLFSILFLAAVVGIFKPFIKGMKRSHFAGLAVVFFIAVGVSAPKIDPAGKKAASTPPPAATASPGAAPAETTPAEAAAPSKWQYSEDKDQMRGTVSRFAVVESENEVDLDFPYGSVRGTITIRQRPEDGLNIMFSVEKGQILCHAFGDSIVSVKFDDKPVQKFRCTGSSDGSSEMAFLQSGARALSGMKGAKRTTIEAEFFQKGRQQFVFDTSGLAWK